MTDRTTGVSISPKSSADEILRFLKSRGSRRNVVGMARFGIKPENNYGVCTPVLFAVAKKVKNDHRLAQRLWDSGIRDARLVACIMDDPDQVTEQQMEDWVKDFDSWDVCDGCCLHLFSWSKHAHKKAREWSNSKEEFVKRAGYVMIATLAIHDKSASDAKFRAYFPLIIKSATDDRNYVKKAVNWALRQIGKRNLTLNKEAAAVAKRIHKMDSRSARWVATDALRELTSEKVMKRLKKEKPSARSH